MIALDTNIVVRLLTGDDAQQQRLATHYIKKHCSADDPAWINRIVTVETVWVLERAYGYTPAQIAGALDKLLRAVEITFEDREAVQAAVQCYRDGAGFADALIAQTNVANGVSTAITFDAEATKRLPAFTLLRGEGR